MATASSQPSSLSTSIPAYNELLDLLGKARGYQNYIAKFLDEHFKTTERITYTLNATDSEVLRWVVSTVLIENSLFFTISKELKKENAIKRLLWDQQQDSFQDKQSVSKLLTLLETIQTFVADYIQEKGGQLDTILSDPDRFYLYVNQYLPDGSKLDQKDLQSIANYALGSSFTTISSKEMEKFLPDIVRRLNKGKGLIPLFRLYLVKQKQLYRQQALQKGSLPILEGASIDVRNRAIHQIAATSRVLKPENTLKLFTTPYEESRLELSNQEKKIDSKGSTEEVATAKEELKMLRRIYGYQAIIYRDEYHHQKKINAFRGSFEDFIEQHKQESLLELNEYSTYNQDEVLFPTTYESIQTVFENSDDDSDGQDETKYTSRSTPLPKRPQKKKSPVEQVKRLEQQARLARLLATNPITIGVGAGLGVGLYGLLTQQLAGGLGAATVSIPGGITGAVLGAKAGAAIGTFIAPGLGTVIGGALGGLVGGAGGAILSGGAALSIQIGDQSLAQLIGQAEINAVTGVGSGTSSTLPTISTGLQTAAPSAVNAANSVASNTINTAVNGASGFMSSLSSGVSIPLSIPIVATPILGAAALAIFVIEPARLGSFIIPGMSNTQSNPYFQISKVVSPDFSDDPTPLTYTIIIAPKDGYNVTITDVVDVMTYQSNSPQTDLDRFPKSAPQDILDQLTLPNPIPQEGVSITYTIDFSSPDEIRIFDDTRIINTLTVGFTATKGDENVHDTFSIIESATFGQPPVVACWPATGRIVQGPFNERSYEGAPGTHSVVDAIDIVGELDSPITIPFSGRVYFYGPNEGWGSVYGNHAVLHTDQGFDLGFAHMNGFVNDFPAGHIEDRMEAGDVIGYMGSTGASYGVHVHYEYRLPTQDVSILETLLPEPLAYADRANWVVTGNQYVDSTTCASQTPQTRLEVGCFQFVDGSQEWTEEELTQYSQEMESLLFDDRVENILCRGGPIQITRTHSDLADQGCQILSLGSGGAEVLSANEIAVCTKLFNQPDLYGKSTMWHEPGHILMRRNPLWSTYYPDRGPASYLRSYPLTKSYTEDFAESFGACLLNSDKVELYEEVVTLSQPMIYRRETLQPAEYQINCDNIDRTIEALNAL